MHLNELVRIFCLLMFLEFFSDNGFHSLILFAVWRVSRKVNLSITPPSETRPLSTGSEEKKAIETACFGRCGVEFKGLPVGRPHF